MTLRQHPRPLLALLTGFLSLSWAQAQEPCTASDDNCAKGSFCQSATGACDAEGTCVAVPAFCTMDMRPVCGCNGKTFDNECKAWAAGVNVASKDGGCDTKDATGGAEFPGGCAANADCDGGYCHFQTGTCGDAIGKCDAIPDVCTKEFNPVCGCNGETFNNKCLASMAGVSVASVDGGCDAGGADAKDVTGGTDAACKAGADCAKGSFCLADAGTCGDSGKCTVVPEACPMNIDPVCGCDDQTYNNACTAWAAGVSVASEDGGCDTKEKTGETDAVGPGHCAGDADCDAGYCHFDLGTCGFNEVVGKCDTLPEMCDDQYDPVCACDGNTYSNACDARRAGQSVASEGECGGAKAQGGCTSAADCDKGSFCQLPTGACDAEGTCVAFPAFCTMDMRPVCACDGKTTYDNECKAWAAGVSVASKDGACDTEKTMGGVCAGDDDCDDGYCHFEVGTCGFGGADGKCDALAKVCTEEYAPVCGCDGQTYDNKCGAGTAGVSVASDGECDDAGGAEATGASISIEETAEGPVTDTTETAKGSSTNSTETADPDPAEVSTLPAPTDSVDAKCCDPAVGPGGCPDENGSFDNCWDEGGYCCADGNWYADPGDGSGSCGDKGLEESRACEEATTKSDPDPDTDPSSGGRSALPSALCVATVLALGLRFLQ